MLEVIITRAVTDHSVNNVRCYHRLFTVSIATYNMNVLYMPLLEKFHGSHSSFSNRKTFPVK